jgi:hypothetical protein
MSYHREEAAKSEGHRKEKVTRDGQESVSPKSTVARRIRWRLPMLEEWSQRALEVDGLPEKRPREFRSITQFEQARLPVADEIEKSPASLRARQSNLKSLLKPVSEVLIPVSAGAKIHEAKEELPGLDLFHGIRNFPPHALGFGRLENHDLRSFHQGRHFLLPLGMIQIETSGAAGRKLLSRLPDGQKRPQFREETSELFFGRRGSDSAE